MPIDFEKMSTFEIAFDLATGKLNEFEKLQALNVIRNRDKNPQISENKKSQKEAAPSSDNLAVKPPLKGSKTEMIYNLALEGRSVLECYYAIKGQGFKVHLPEIYRVFKKYKL
jgi:hypothetical protein